LSRGKAKGSFENMTLRMRKRFELWILDVLMSHLVKWRREEQRTYKELFGERVQSADDVLHIARIEGISKFVSGQYRASLIPGLFMRPNNSTEPER